MSIPPSFKDKGSSILSTNITNSKQSKSQYAFLKQIYGESNINKSGYYRKNKSISKLPRFDFDGEKYKIKSSQNKSRDLTRKTSKVNDYLDKSLYEGNIGTNGNTEAMYNNANIINTGTDNVKYNITKRKDIPTIKSNNNDSLTGISKNEGTIDLDQIRSITRTNSSTFNKKIGDISVGTTTHNNHNYKGSHGKKEIDLFKAELQNDKQFSCFNNYLNLTQFQNSNSKHPILNITNPIKIRSSDKINYQSNESENENHRELKTNKYNMVQTYIRMTNNISSNGNGNSNSNNNSIINGKNNRNYKFSELMKGKAVHKYVCDFHFDNNLKAKNKVKLNGDF